MKLLLSTYGSRLSSEVTIHVFVFTSFIIILVIIECVCVSALQCRFSVLLCIVVVTEMFLFMLLRF